MPRAAPVAVTLALASLALALALGAPSQAALSGRIYRNADCRIRTLELPRGWDLVPTSQIPYPRVLVMGTRDRARLTVVAQRVLPGITALDLAADARRLLLRQGWEDPSIAHGEPVYLDAALEGGRRLLRQAYLVSGDLAFVVSVVTPHDRRERSVRDFEQTVRSLVVDPPEAADGGVADGSRCR